MRDIQKTAAREINGRPVDLLYVCGKLSQLDPSDPYIFGPNFFRPGLYGKHEDNPGKIYKSARGDMKFMYYSVYYINKQSKSKIKKATLIAVALGVFSHRVFTNTSESRRDARRRLHTAKAGVVLESQVGH